MIMTLIFVLEGEEAEASLSSMVTSLECEVLIILIIMKMMSDDQKDGEVY